MILYVNDIGEIKDVDFTKDKSLTPLEVNEETNPFLGWSTAKICCFKVIVIDGEVIMMTPYVDSRLLGHIDRQGRTEQDMKDQILVLQDYVVDNEYQNTLKELGVM